jgi:hypothetical protein
MTNSNPSLNPADNGTLAGTMQFAFKKMMQQVDGMMPAQVIAYDRTTNRVQVQIMITQITTSGTQIPRSQVASIPVIVLGGGGFVLSFPIKPGDFGWILASDRDTSLFLQSAAQSPPNTMRLKSFSDGVFIPSLMTSLTIDGDDVDKITIQSADSLTKISIGNDSIDIVSPVKININAPDIMIDLGDDTNILNVNGSIVATGTITP